MTLLSPALFAVILYLHIDMRKEIQRQNKVIGALRHNVDQL